jgi:SAM-dependent methyltransferase
MNRSIAAVLALLAGLALTVPASAQEPAPDTYKQSLVKQFPFYNVAHQVFAPVYPATARQLVQDYAITAGVCVDVGGAEGSLAIELAKITQLTVYVLDLSPAAVRLCNLSADEAGLTGRVRAVEGDAQSLPFKDGFADLVVSRNSLFEWPDMMAGLKEAFRILKPGGVAYMGGGFSRLLAGDDLARVVDWCSRKKAEKPEGWVEMDREILARLRAEGMQNVRQIEGPTEFDWWLEIRK